MLSVSKTKYEYSLMHVWDYIALSFYPYGVFFKKMRSFCIFLLVVAKANRENFVVHICILCFDFYCPMMKILNFCLCTGVNRNMGFVCLEQSRSFRNASWKVKGFVHLCTVPCNSCRQDDFKSALVKL